MNAELDTAIRAGCYDGRDCSYPDCGNDGHNSPCSGALHVLGALRSLATPTPEVIEAMAKALAGSEFAPVPSEYKEAKVMYAALWAHILGEAK